uniref:Putative secreted protein n=1 Tax=Ixodes ricinus TaxID=34613 RepID=A0A6B0V376_IXORI
MSCLLSSLALAVRSGEWSREEEPLDAEGTVSLMSPVDAQLVCCNSGASWVGDVSHRWSSCFRIEMGVGGLAAPSLHRRPYCWPSGKSPLGGGGANDTCLMSGETGLAGGLHGVGSRECDGEESASASREERTSSRVTSPSVVGCFLRVLASVFDASLDLSTAASSLGSNAAAEEAGEPAVLEPGLAPTNEDSIQTAGLASLITTSCRC